MEYVIILAVIAPISFDFLIRPIRWIRGGLAVEFLDGAG